MLDLDQADTARQLAGKVGTERDVEAEDSRRAASAGTMLLCFVKGPMAFS
jgi:hypothetical protein